MEGVVKAVHEEGMGGEGVGGGGRRGRRLDEGGLGWGYEEELESGEGGGWNGDFKRKTDQCLKCGERPLYWGRGDWELPVGWGGGLVGRSKAKGSRTISKKIFL